MSQNDEQPVAQIHLYKNHLTAQITKVKLSYRMIVGGIIIILLILGWALGYNLGPIADLITVVTGFQLLK